MHGLRGTRAGEKSALVPDPLWRSLCGFTILDSRRGYGLWHLGKVRGDSLQACGAFDLWTASVVV